MNPQITPMKWIFYLYFYKWSAGSLNLCKVMLQKPDISIIPHGVFHFWCLLLSFLSSVIIYLDTWGRGKYNHSSYLSWQSFSRFICSWEWLKGINFLNQIPEEPELYLRIWCCKNMGLFRISSALWCTFEVILGSTLRISPIYVIIKCVPKMVRLLGKRAVVSSLCISSILINF